MTTDRRHRERGHRINWGPHSPARAPQGMESGQRLTVKFDGRQRYGGACGWVGTWKIVPSPHYLSVRSGETWEVEVVLWWGEGDADKDGGRQNETVAWGNVVYVAPIRRLEDDGDDHEA